MTELFKAYLAFTTKNKEKLLEATSDYAYMHTKRMHILNAFMTHPVI